MDRRAFIGALAGSLGAGPLVVEGQPTGRTVHIGILSTGQTRSSPIYQAFEQRLRELGYIEGRNAAVDFRTAEGKLERIAPLTRELKQLKIDVLLTAGPDATIQAVKEAADALPVVMVAIDFDPVANGHVASLAHPGGNMTGVTFRQLELAAKRLELIKEALPRATRIAVLWDAAAAEQLKPTLAATSTLDLQLESVELRNSPYDFEGAFRKISRGRAEALLVLTTPLIFRERAQIAGRAMKSRLPTFFAFREHVEAGGLCSYGPNFSAMFRRAAEYVDKILKGAKPADLPVEQPTTFELVINLKTAKVLGLTIPPSLLQRADQVIE